MVVKSKKVNCTGWITIQRNLFVLPDFGHECRDWVNRWLSKRHRIAANYSFLYLIWVHTKSRIGERHGNMRRREETEKIKLGRENKTHTTKSLRGNEVTTNLNEKFRARNRPKVEYKKNCTHFLDRYLGPNLFIAQAGVHKDSDVRCLFRTRIEKQLQFL